MSKRLSKRPLQGKIQGLMAESGREGLSYHQQKMVLAKAESRCSHEQIIDERAGTETVKIEAKQEGIYMNFEGRMRQCWYFMEHDLLPSARSGEAVCFNREREKESYWPIFSPEIDLTPITLPEREEHNLLNAHDNSVDERQPLGHRSSLLRLIIVPHPYHWIGGKDLNGGGSLCNYQSRGNPENG